MFGLQIIDILVIVGYFLVVLGIGFWSMRRIKNQEDYFLAGRRFGKIVQAFAAFGQSTDTASAVSTTTTTVVNGASGIWSSFCYIFNTPVYWITAKWYRRLRLLTMGDFFEDRYGSKMMSGIYAIVSSCGLMVIISLSFNAMGKTVVALTPKPISEYSSVEKAEYEQAMELEELEDADYNTLTPQQKERLDELRLIKPEKVFSYIDREALIWIVCVVVLVYAAAGGLEAAFLSDTLQGFFLLILSFLMIPFAFSKINSIYGGEGVMGALNTIHHQLPESFFEMLGSPEAIDFTWYYIATLMLMITINLGVQANQLVATGSAKDEFTARVGFSTGLYMKRLCTILWGFFALSGILLYSKSVSDPDLVFGYAVKDLLGPAGLGLVGLMIACLIAALMSTADCLMITSSSLLTHNVVRPLLPNIGEKKFVAIGRVLGAVTILGGGYVAIHYEDIFQQLKLSWEITAVFAASFWLGMLWRRTNRKAAWSSIAVTLILFFVLPVIIPAIPGVRTNEYMVKRTDPRIIQRTYTAHKMDVTRRASEIEEWRMLDSETKAVTAKPKPLTVGQEFDMSCNLPAKSIFWTEGVNLNEQGQLQGEGILNPGLVIIDKIGWDLGKNSYALNETVRISLRVIVPFMILIVVSLLTVADKKSMLDKFYVKMKTPVGPDPEVDKKEMEKSIDNTERFDYLKLFPDSQWEMCKWNKLDVIGFIISISLMFGLVLFLFWLVGLGG